MKENRFKQYEDLPLTLTVPEIGEALGMPPTTWFVPKASHISKLVAGY